MPSLKVFIFLMTLCFSLPVLADNFFYWHEANIRLLRGNNFELGDKDRTIVTVEYANGGRYGDFYSFIDYIEPDSGDSDYYGEIHPRFSLSNLSGKEIKFGIITDLLLAFTVEKPKGFDETLLYGVGTNWDIPGFVFFQANGYVRDNPDLEGKSEQVTIAWKSGFTFLNNYWVFEGFSDIAGPEGDSAPTKLIVPGLLWDVKNVWSQLKKEKLTVGIKYTYTKNKYGIRGVIERVPQFQIKWIF